MKKTTKQAEKYRSELADELLSEVTPTESLQTETKMLLAARIDDFIKAIGLNKGQFATRINKSPSEISKWLSGTHNFTIDTLVEISLALGVRLNDLFVGDIKPVHVMSCVVSSEDMPQIISLHTPVSGLRRILVSNATNMGHYYLSNLESNLEGSYLEGNHIVQTGRIWWGRTGGFNVNPAQGINYEEVGDE